MKRNAKLLFICQGAIIAAIYVVLTYVAGALGLDSGVIQVRFSEMLCILPMFTPAAIPGVTLGCLLSNLLLHCEPMDIFVGAFATLIGAFGTYWLRRYKWIAPLPPIVANVVLIPWVLRYAYGAPGSIPYFMLTIGIGEIISVYVLGMLLYFALQKRAAYIFKLK